MQRALLCLLLLVTACDQGPPLRLGSNPWPGYLGLYYARDLGLLDNRRVQLLDFDSAEDVMRALRNQAIDAAAVTLDEALVLANSRLAIRIVMAFDISYGADVLLARKPIAALSELRGQRIGVETSALGAYMLARILEKAGLESTDVTVVHVPFSDHANVFRDNKVDFLITFDPARSRLVADGAYVAFSSKELPGEIVDVLVVREQALRENRAGLAHLVDSYFQAIEVLKSQPSEAAEILAGRSQLQPDQVLAAWKNIELSNRKQNRELISADASGLKPTLERLQKIMLRAGLIEREMPVSTLIDDQLLREESP